MKFTTVIILFFFTSLAQAQQKAVLKQEFTFDKAPFKECHASTIEYTPAGLVVAYFGGTKEQNPDVEIWVQRRVNNRWTAPVSVANGIQHSKKRYPCWNPVLYQVPGGALLLFYKVGPSPQTWWGELITSKDHGKTWSAPQRLPEDILGPIKNKPVLLKDGTLLCPSSTEVTSGNGWRMHFEMTKDWGKTWSITEKIDTASAVNAIQPSVLFHKGGRLQLLARSKDDGVVNSWSDDNGVSWSELEKEVLPNPNSGTDAVTLSNGTQLLIYNHVGKTGNQWGGRRSPLNLAISKDGISWKNVVTLESENGEFSYPAIIRGKDGLVYISYTWNRQKIKFVIVDPAKLEKI
ncbi:MAG: exo-alpha-sialidase [Niabella sp.]